ncbi:intraflagellar transport protein 20 homolog isoform X2 [Rhinoderma darwinii]|uniref:intraflagellar transport protein 20 homolog isoform X2 n=1 Tax=Rhinoderma darwinii TaxID=43563 RepID=UPI003F66797B
MKLQVPQSFAATIHLAMAKDSLSEAGLHFDELNKIRILDPDVSQQTTELKEECREFVEKIDDFQKIVGGLIELVDQLAKETESEKMKAIGARNLLKSIAKQREAQQQQLQALIAEKKMQLERYRIEYEALCKVEAEQNEFIDQFILQKQPGLNVTRSSGATHTQILPVRQTYSPLSVKIIVLMCYSCMCVSFIYIYYTPLLR